MSSTPLLDAAHELLTWLNEAGFKGCLIGGVVVQRWGEPRLTADVDATIAVGYGDEAAFLDSCLGRFAARRADAHDFALKYRVLLVEASNGVPLDLSLASFDFEIEAIERATPYEYDTGITLTTCSAEDLLIYKAVAGRPRDLSDIETIVARQGEALDLDRVRRWLRVFAELRQDVDLEGPFEEALRRTRRDGGSRRK